MNIFYNLFLIEYGRQFTDTKMIDFPFERYENFLEEFYQTNKNLNLRDFIFRANNGFHRRLELEKRADLFSGLKIETKLPIEWVNSSGTFFQKEFAKIMNEEIAKEILSEEKNRMEEAIKNIKHVAEKYEKEWHQDGENDRKGNDLSSNG